ncbi:MAG TPA: hypothetical protein VJZ68_07305 [Nitrososphaera sp.]|nr:hypothetical protein [Nitrososphaera sp.]
MGLSTQESGSLGIAIVLVIAVVDLVYTGIIIAEVDVTNALAAILIAALVGVLVWGFRPRITSK